MWFATAVFKKKPSVPDSGHENARTGSWGEDVAACFLQNCGWKIVGRRVRPCMRVRPVELAACALDMQRDRIGQERWTRRRGAANREGRQAERDVLTLGMGRSLPAGRRSRPLADFYTQIAKS